MRRRTNPGLGSPPPRYPGTFLLALRAALANLHWKFRGWRGPAASVGDELGQCHSIGLDNLFRRLRRQPREQWIEHLTRFLEDVPRDPREFALDALAEVAERLLFRLGPAPLDAPEGAKFWYHPLLGDELGVTLVVDFPASMSYVSEEQVRDSGKNGLEWLDIARANLRRITPADCFRTTNADAGLLQCRVEDAYDSSRALLLDDLLPDQSPHGWFVAMPGRDQLLLLPVGSDAIELLPWFKMLTQRSHREVAYPISPDIYWLRAGEWHRFDIATRDGKILIAPPPEFLELLDSLAPEISFDEAPPPFEDA